MTAKWPLHYLFYNWYAGQRFMKKGVSPAVQQAFLAEFHSELHTPGLRAKMRLVGREMKPPVGLAGQLSSRTKVHLVWGTHDVHYPRWIPEVIRPLSQASLQWVNGGHYCMWENPTVFTRALENIRNNTL
jgi:pimeloyl-ACP methyl ester carboxylesterase